MRSELDYEAIFKGLNDYNIDYLVVGGLAVNFHGVPRMTYDIDLMILLEPSNIKKTIDILSEWGYRSRLPVDPSDLVKEDKRTEWIREKNMKAFSFYNEDLPIGGIDLVIDSPIPYDELKQRAVTIKLEEQNVRVISIRDLIRLKQAAARDQDLADVESLMKIIEK